MALRGKCTRAVRLLSGRGGLSRRRRREGGRGRINSMFLEGIFFTLGVFVAIGILFCLMCMVLLFFYVICYWVQERDRKKKKVQEAVEGVAEGK